MKRKLAVFAACALVMVVTGGALRRSGVAVEVENRENVTIRSVEVRTSAGTYPLGDLAPGASASTVVGARGESGAAIAWTAQDGTQRSSKEMDYFEGSTRYTGVYGGYLRFTIENGGSKVEGGTTFTLLNLWRFRPACSANR